MENELYLFIKKNIKLTIATLWIVILFGILSIIFSSIDIFSIIVFIFIGISAVALSVLLVVSIYYILKISRNYKNSEHFKHTNKNYFDLKNKEKVVYNVSVSLKEKFNIECQFNHDSIEHLFFIYKNIPYSILVKEYNGDILGNSLEKKWKIGYKKQKDNTYFNKITVSNPILQNQRIIERNYNNKQENIKNLILVTYKTDKSPLLRQVVHIDELIKLLSK